MARIEYVVVKSIFLSQLDVFKWKKTNQNYSTVKFSSLNDQIKKARS